MRSPIVRTMCALASVLSLLIAACGSDESSPFSTQSSPQSTSTTMAPATTSTAAETTSTAASEAVRSREDVLTCLQSAGLEVVTGADVPRVSGVDAIGVLSSTGEGNIMPGTLAAAVFVFSSVDEADGAKDSLLFFAEMHVGDNVVVVFDPPPASAFLESVNVCAFGG